MVDLTNKNLIAQGRMNVQLAEQNMLALMRVRERFTKKHIFKGVRIGMALHLTKETAVLVQTLIAGGAEIAITSCNPLSAQDDVIAFLQNHGVQAYGYKGESLKEYYQFLKKVIEFKPQITIDDGCDLVSMIHTEFPAALENIIGGCEETTTGVLRLRAMAKDHKLRYPVVAVNDNDTKHLMDNYYGTGQSTLDGIMRASNVLFAGKTVVVAGYGDCGKGVALRSKGLGAKVIVTEIQSFRALQAHMDGFEVMPMGDAAKRGDIFITVTGNCDVIRPEHIRWMKSGAILANSGHFDVEIDVKGLEKLATKCVHVRPFLDEYVIGKKKIYLVGEGRLANLAAAEGHPSEIMSLSFCGQALAVEYLLQQKGKLEAGVYALPKEVDEQIAALENEVLGVKIDKLNKKQQAYLAGWESGT